MKDLLKERCYKVKSESTLMRMSKKELIMEIRTLENNWNGEIWTKDLQTSKLVNLSVYFDSHGGRDLFIDICMGKYRNKK